MGMYGDDIKIEANKAALLKVLRRNRETHIVDYGEALEGFVSAARDALRDRLNTFMQDSSPIEKLNPSFNSPLKPQSHAMDYNRAIQMLEMHTGETFSIDMSMYRKFIEDDWDWKSNFTTVRNSYKQ
jgi:hypothetical protein